LINHKTSDTQAIQQSLRNLPPGSRAQHYHTIIPPYFVNYLQSTSLIDAFEIVTVHTFDPPTATLFLQLIQLINSLPLVFLVFFLLLVISETVTLFLIIFCNWETFTVNFAVDTEQPLTMSGSAEAV